MTYFVKSRTQKKGDRLKLSKIELPCEFPSLTALIWLYWQLLLIKLMLISLLLFYILCYHKVCLSIPEPALTGSPEVPGPPIIIHGKLHNSKWTQSQNIIHCQASLSVSLSLILPFCLFSSRYGERETSSPIYIHGKLHNSKWTQSKNILHRRAF